MINGARKAGTSAFETIILLLFSRPTISWGLREGDAVTPKCLGGPPVDRDRRNAHPGDILTFQYKSTRGILSTDRIILKLGQVRRLLLLTINLSKKKLLLHVRRSTSSRLIAMKIWKYRRIEVEE
ncbi:hypothetical protein TNCV_948661 [Trichonephila clavipes]|nr:hypothetical protein TNCV_948661 [Trichonephila clavipes]